MGRQLGRCKKCNCQATIEERDNGVCIWCSARKLENEDISWLLNEISALRDELARVKVESLRVVVDGEAISVDFLPVGIRISVPDRTGVYRRVGSGASTKPEPHSFVILEDCNSGEEINVPYGTQGYVVRLERWEDE